MLVDGEPVHFRSGKAKELMALCVYRDGRPVSIHEIVENLWERTPTAPATAAPSRSWQTTLRDYGAEEMFLRAGEPAGADGPGGLGFSGIHERR